MGYHDKPVGLLNVEGYYDRLLSFLETSVANQFMGDWQMNLIHSDARVPELLRQLVEEAGLTAEPRLDAL